jgi:hypothetical protein
VRMTWGNEPHVVDTVVKMMMGSGGAGELSDPARHRPSVPIARPLRA